MEHEIEFEQWIEQLFQQPPSKQRILISFEEDDMNRFFERLLQVFYLGSQILFGETNGKVRIENWTNNEFDLMDQYFCSFGIHIRCKKVDVFQAEAFLLHVRDASVTYDEEKMKVVVSDYVPLEVRDFLKYKHYKTNLLEDKRFQLLVGSYVYIIWFERISKSNEK